MKDARKILALALITLNLLATAKAWGQNLLKPRGERVSYKAEMLGRFVRAEISQPPGERPGNYYFVHKNKGREYAYPVEFKDQAIKQAVEKFSQDRFWVEAVLKSETVWIEDSETEVVLLEVEKAKPIRLAWLSVPYESYERILEQEERGQALTLYQVEESPRKYQTKITVPDQLANGILFISGAATLASMIASMQIGSYSPFLPPLIEWPAP